MISIQPQDITGIIISGGFPSHGHNKSVVQIREDIALRTLHNLLRLFCSEVIVSAGCPVAYHFMNEKIVFDKIDRLGAIGSVLSCLSESVNKKNLVISHDMPMVPVGLLHLLIQKKDTADFVAPASGLTTIEPFCAIYDKSVVSAITRMIAEGDYSLYNLRHYCKTELIQVYNGNNIFKKLKTSNILKKGPSGFQF